MKAEIRSAMSQYCLTCNEDYSLRGYSILPKLSKGGAKRFAHFLLFLTERRSSSLIHSTICFFAGGSKGDNTIAILLGRYRPHRFSAAIIVSSCGMVSYHACACDTIIQFRPLRSECRLSFRGVGAGALKDSLVFWRDFFQTLLIGWLPATVKS
jgi:hypothetical protein